jgi:hypothetical protein
LLSFYLSTTEDDILIVVACVIDPSGHSLLDRHFIQSLEAGEQGAVLEYVGISRYFAVTWPSLTMDVDDGNLLVSRENKRLQDTCSSAGSPHQ